MFALRHIMANIASARNNLPKKIIFLYKTYGNFYFFVV